MDTWGERPGWAGAGGRATAALQATTRHLQAAVPGLDQAVAAMAVRQATGPGQLRELHDYLAAHPDALASGDLEQAPQSLIRVTRYLAGQQIAGIRMPTCAHCGRTGQDLPGRVPGGRVCHSCQRKAASTVCAGCGHLRLVHRRSDQGPLCSRCAGRPLRVCGRCGRTARVDRRATATTPDLCHTCNQVQLVGCAVCGKTKRCRRVGDGAMVCAACRAATRTPRRACCQCGRSRIVTATWPAGPVCHTCYERTLNNPRPCPGCRRRAVLIATSADGTPICGPCAGSTLTYDCRECGQPCRPFADRGCARRVLTERVHQLLPADAHPELQVLAATLAGADKPRAVIRWLNGPTGRTLTDLTATGQPLTHASLDALPDRDGVDYLRSLLVTTGVLPERDDYLEHVAARIDQLLAGHPAPQANLVRRYACWDVMIRARRRRARSARPSSSTTSQHLRRKIRTALDFLTWLDQHSIGLDRLTHSDLDLYLTQRATTDTLDSFIKWLRHQDLVGDVRMPPRPTKPQPTPIPEPDRWRLLHRCLHDDDLPLQVRAAAALVLLYGYSVTRIVTLTADALTSHDGQHYLTVTSRPVPLPPALATLLTQLRDQARPHSTLARAVESTRWLFPGRRPGTHRDGLNFTRALAAEGIEVRAGRTAALMALAEQLPATVLGPLLGLAPNTAATWTRLVQRDWTDYLAARTLPI